MTQLGSTASTCAAQWKMWLFEVSCVIYLTAVCAAQDSENVTSPSQTPTVQQTTTAYVPPTPVLDLKTQWPDVFPTEKVEFTCKISDSSGWTFFWKRDGTDIDASDPNLSLSGDGSVLTVTAEHSGSYSCIGRDSTRKVESKSSDQRQLTVSQNKPKPQIVKNASYSEMYPGESIIFTCDVHVSSGWEYQWYHDGREIQPPGNEYLITSLAKSDGGQYYCKARRGQQPFYTEDSESISLIVSDPPTPVLKLQSQWLDVFHGESLSFSCKVESPGWTYTWYHKQNLLQGDSTLSIDEVGGLLTIPKVTQANEGNYKCQAQLKSRGVTSGFSNPEDVTVYENLQIPTLSKVPALDKMYVDEEVNFTCSMSVSTGWKYQWYLNGNKHRESNGPFLHVKLGLIDDGEYSCKATRSVTSTGDSNKIRQGVLETPVPSLSRVTGWSDVFPTERVELRCEIPGSLSWTYSWYKDTNKIEADSDWLFDSNRATLNIASASAKHKGQYTCKGQLKGRSVTSNSSPELTLTVYDMKPTVRLTQNPDYKVMYPGEQVSFSCHINVSSGWEYEWYKDGIKLSASKSTLSIDLSEATDSGSYSCKAKRGSGPDFITDSTPSIRLDVKGKKPETLLTQQPDANSLYIGESVSFECTVKDSSGWKYFWFKDGAALPDQGSTFKINDIDLSNIGTYKCEAKRDETMIDAISSVKTLSISEIPVPSLKNMTPWLDVFPTERVKLRCGMENSPDDWKYTWYRNSSRFPNGDTDTHTLLISSASTSDSGSYSCSGTLKARPVDSNSSSELLLEVYGGKPSVSLVVDPDYKPMYTEESLSFMCHVNVSSGWKYRWNKDGNPLSTSEHKHSIRSVQTADSGSYNCTAERESDSKSYSVSIQTAAIEVKERPPASLILLTGWSDVFSTDSLLLQCEVMESADKWNYTWYKEGQEIEGSYAEKHTVTPQNDPDQSNYVCRGSRTGRPSYSRKSDSFKTKNLLLKRRVLLSISGLLFFGIIAIFIGCIFLRVFRKPATNDDKHEEDNLFMTMAQQKGCDAPCPLAVYITDAALNAPLKEEDENGTLCSETTPLPITTQEDQADTSDNQKTTETNGGLVSFQ